MAYEQYKYPWITANDEIPSGIPVKINWPEPEKHYSKYYVKHKPSGIVTTRFFKDSNAGSEYVSQKDAQALIDGWNASQSTNEYSLSEGLGYTYYYFQDKHGVVSKHSFFATGFGDVLSKEQAEERIAELNAKFGHMQIKYSLNNPTTLNNALSSCSGKEAVSLDFAESVLFSIDPSHTVGTAINAPKPPSDPTKLKLWHMRARERNTFYNAVAFAVTKEEAKVKMLRRMASEYGSSFYNALSDTQVHEITNDALLLTEYNQSF